MRSAVKCGPGSSTSRLTSWSKSQVSASRFAVSLLFFMLDKNQNPTSHPFWHLTRQILSPQSGADFSHLCKQANLTVICFVFAFFVETVERENNKDYNQVLLDVQRSLRRFPPGKRSSCFSPVCSTRCIDRGKQHSQAAVLYNGVLETWENDC